MRRRDRLAGMLGMLFPLLACVGARRPTSPPAIAAPTSAAFEAIAERILDHQLEAHPQRGVELGLHGYDGRLPDVSPTGMIALQRQLHDDIAALGRVDDARTGLATVEFAALLNALLTDRFELEVQRSPWRNPMYYLGALDLTPYISRDYAPLETRAAAIAKIAAASVEYLAHAQARLEPRLPRTFLDTALLQTRGSASFVRKDVATALAGLGDTALMHRCTTALAAMAAALDRYADHLEGLRPNATDDFALGQEIFAQMLRETQGLDVDLGRLRGLLQADLDRNLAALDAAAAEIDPSASTAVVVARVAQSKSGDVLALATQQSATLRAFLLSADLLTIPSDELVHVVESPPFLRWNAAFLSPSGPFERGGLPSFYYISPPDPSWPVQAQRDYLPGVHDLLFITIHEVWPGHFAHALHLRRNPSRVLKSTWNYTTAEGWAHYAEEMMWEAGVDPDPRAHVGQLLNALLRDVRALSALGLHTEGWDVERSRHMFVEHGFQDEASAAQQAVRGTFDPMYLAYTVGKLVIRKLRDDVAARRGAGFSLREFHDELLSHGAAPLGAIRRAMLGESSGDASPLL